MHPEMRQLQQQLLANRIHCPPSFRCRTLAACMREPSLNSAVQGCTVAASSRAVAFLQKSRSRMWSSTPAPFGCPVTSFLSGCCHHWNWRVVLLLRPLTLPLKMLLRLVSHQLAYAVTTECAHSPLTSGARLQRCQPDWLVLSANPEILLSIQSNQPPQEMLLEWYGAWSLQTPPKLACTPLFQEEPWQQPQVVVHHGFPH